MKTAGQISMMGVFIISLCLVRLSLAQSALLTQFEVCANNSRYIDATNSFPPVANEVSPPQFTQQPSSQLISPGEGFSLCSMADGFPSPAYQWQYSCDGINYTNIAGATSTCYSQPASGLTNIGYYRVAASNSGGTIFSSVVTVGYVRLNLLASVCLTAAIGSNYRIDAASQLSPTNWTPVTDITITKQPFIYVDYSSVTNKQQFYRVVPL